MRRKEYEKKDLASADLVLSEAKVGHLAFHRGDELELLPYNFGWDGEYLYFHASPKTGLAEAAGSKVKFLAYSRIAWIPSHWRNPKMACPATTYFCSISQVSVLEEVKDRAIKAHALTLFMKKYQDDQSYMPLTDKAYHGSLDALFVGRVAVHSPVTKMKMGQHLTPKHRKKVFDKLRERGETGDREVAETMKLANPDLTDEERWVEELTSAQLADLTDVLSGTYWAKGRSMATQQGVNRGSQILMAYVEGDKVLAFARVVLMSPGAGYLGDVVVREGHRGQGLGTDLMKRICEHPKVKQLHRFMLVTRDQESLYRKFGFVEKYRTDTTFMVKEGSTPWAGKISV